MMPAHDREIEKIEQMGIDAAVELLWERDAAVQKFLWNDRGVLWAIHFRTITKKGVEALGVTVECDDLGNVLEVKLPVSGYFKDALKEKEPVSVPGLGEDISSHGEDPCVTALRRSGRLVDYDEWCATHPLD